MVDVDVLIGVQGVQVLVQRVPPADLEVAVIQMRFKSLRADTIVPLKPQAVAPTKTQRIHLFLAKVDRTDLETSAVGSSRKRSVEYNPRILRRLFVHTTKQEIAEVGQHRFF